MAHDHSDDDVIVISEDEARHSYENAPVDPADSAAGDELAASDPDADPDGHPATEPVTPASSADGAGTGTVNGNGSAIPMPGSAAAPAASTTPADGIVPPGAPSDTPAVSDGNWPQIQALFVDDPLAAVQQAADVVGGAMAALTAAATNREQTLRGGWQGDRTGTEDLRTALREYRDLAARLSTLARDL
jgi:hypothetical protein